MCVCVCVCVRARARALSHVWLFMAPQTIKDQSSPPGPLPREFSRQEYWHGVPFPILRVLPDPGIEPMSLVSHDWQVDSLPLVPLGKPPLHYIIELIGSYKKVDDLISFLQFKFEFCNKDFMIWATVISRSYFCWLYRASPSLVTKNIINLISVLTIRWCSCVASSLVLLEEGVCYDQCQRIFKLLHNCTHLTHQQSNAQNSPSQASKVHEPWTSRCLSWI